MILKPTVLISSRYIYRKFKVVQDTKLTFSREEMDAISDSRFFFVKHEATQKIHALFGELEKELMKRISGYSFLGTAGLQVKDKGKIFRGENYQLLPYILLDCPRLFTTETVFSFRSMFWWGNEFSFTLHIQGKALEIFRESIRRNITILEGENFFFCVNDTPWQYSFDKKNYRLLDEMLHHDPVELNRQLTAKTFLKFSRKIELGKYRESIPIGIDTFEKLMEVLQR
jgi:hypothetical protein